MEKIKLKDILEKQDITTKNNSRLIKLHCETIKNLCIIYHLDGFIKDYYKYSFSEESYTPICVYDKNKEIAIITNYIAEYILDVENIGTIEVDSISTFIREKLECEIKKYITSNYNTLKLNDEVNISGSSAKEYYIKDKHYSIEEIINDLSIEASNYNSTSYNDLMNYLIDSDEVISSLFNTLIYDNYDRIINSLSVKKKFSKAIEELYNNPGDLKINKDIYNSLKPFENAMNINITIDYDGDTITFKFDKERFERYLFHSLTFSDWGKSWEKVEKFLYKHKERYELDPDFKNVTKITYGKKVVYERDNKK